MKNQFIITCESTCDLPYSYLVQRGVPVIFYKFVINGKQFEDNADRDKSASEQFYKQISEGGLPSTSQINAFEYEEFFKGVLKEHDCDILHIAFGTGMTPSYFKALEAVKNISTKHKIVVIDSLCSSSGYGLLVDEALDMRDNGCKMSEIQDYLMQNRNKIHHQFFSTDLTLFKRSGRVSGLSAMLAGILDINPIMHLNAEGRIIAYAKVRGKKRSIQKTASEILEHADGGSEYCGKLFIAHSDCEDLALQMKDEIQKIMPNQVGKIRLLNIGLIIASHCGKGTVAVFFHGDEREL